MAYPESTRRAVRASYISGLPLKAAATANSVPYQTSRAWKAKSRKEGDDWDIARAAQRISGEGVKALNSVFIEELVHQFESTLKALKKGENMPATEQAKLLSSLADAYSKTVSAARASNPKINNLAIALDVIKDFSDFLKKTPARLAGALHRSLRAVWRRAKL